MFVNLVVFIGYLVLVVIQFCCLSLPGLDLSVVCLLFTCVVGLVDCLLVVWLGWLFLGVA